MDFQSKFESLRWKNHNREKKSIRGKFLCSILPDNLNNDNIWHMQKIPYTASDQKVPHHRLHAFVRLNKHQISLTAFSHSISFLCSSLSVVQELKMRLKRKMPPTETMTNEKSTYSGRTFTVDCADKNGFSIYLCC